ncbi:hypothetical protein HI914_02417 [Erysiphe necator]|nr:hypothetical protein HI914_02417 [Erysiphe necator]
MSKLFKCCRKNSKTNYVNKEKKSKTEIKSLEIPAGIPYNKIIEGERKLILTRSRQNKSVGIAIDYIGAFLGRKKAFLRVTPPITKAVTTTNSIDDNNSSKKNNKTEQDKNDEPAENQAMRPPSFSCFSSYTVLVDSVQVPTRTYYPQAYLLPVHPVVVAHYPVLLHPILNKISPEGYIDSNELCLASPFLTGHPYIFQ